MKCPNCKNEIGRFELGANCKCCGVNIFYAQQKSLLTEDAKRCELEYASFHILVSKLKTAFVGGKIQVLRIVAMVLAIGAIFIPFATIEADFNMFSAKLSFGAFGIYQAFTDGTLQVILSLKNYAPELTVSVILMLAFIVLIFLSGLGVFLALVLSFLNIQKTAKATKVLAFIGMFFSFLAFIETFLFHSLLSDLSFIEAKTGIGSVACFVVLLFIFVLNRLVITKNIQPEIKEVDLERVKIRKQIKKGEVSYSELSLPVLESEEEKELRIQANTEKEKIVQAAKEGGQKE